MIIKATFTGTNSLGYENGKEYELVVSKDTLISIKRVVSCDLYGYAICHYTSLTAFLKNWNNIQTIG